jgi:hypothetical protein
MQSAAFKIWHHRFYVQEIVPSREPHVMNELNLKRSCYIRRLRRRKNASYNQLKFKNIMHIIKTRTRIFRHQSRKYN